MGKFDSLKNFKIPKGTAFGVILAIGAGIGAIIETLNDQKMEKEHEEYGKRLSELERKLKNDD